LDDAGVTHQTQLRNVDLKHRTLSIGITFVSFSLT
jgi:hypothetical protein